MAEVVRECLELTGAGEPLVLAKRPLPSPAPRGIVLKTSRAGICHSDVHFWEDESPMPDGSVWRHRDIPDFRFSGITMGHEIVGSVFSKGAQVEGLNVGDRVVVYPWTGCMECDACRAGYNNLCSNNRHGTTDFGQGGVSGCADQGGYSTYVWVPDARYTVLVPWTLDLSVAATLPCAALTSYNALGIVKPKMEMLSKIYASPWLVVMGCGGLGLWCLKLAPYRLPANTQILAVDISPAKLSVVMDCETLLLPDKDEEIVRQLREKTNGGPCAIIDFVGSPLSLGAELKSLRKGTIVSSAWAPVVIARGKGGQYHVIGLYGAPIITQTQHLISNTITISGSRTGSVYNLRDLVKLVADNEISGPPIDHVTLSDVNRVLVDLREGRVRGRAVVKFD